MVREAWDLTGRRCFAQGEKHACFLLIQPADTHDLELMEREIGQIRALCSTPFLHLAFQVEDWNDDLSPWGAAPVFGDQAFSGLAADTLRWTEETLLPEILKRYGIGREAPVIVGGYSLAGLFALWSVYQTDCFSGAACASPSLWFPGWISYAEKHVPRTERIYLSLGDREEKTRNVVMARAGDCIRRQQELLRKYSPPVESTLEWNEGNHFRDPDLRTARAFAWCMNQPRDRK